MGGQGFHVRQADEVGRVGTEPLLLIVVLRTQRPGGLPPTAGDIPGPCMSRRRARASGLPAAAAAARVLQGQASLRQPPPAVQADARLRRAGGLASRGAADAPAQQRMPGIDRQHPGDRIPAGLGQERRVDPRGQHGRLLIQQHRPRAPRTSPARPGMCGPAARSAAAALTGCSTLTGHLPPSGAGLAPHPPRRAAGPGPDAHTPAWR